MDTIGSVGYMVLYNWHATNNNLPLSPSSCICGCSAGMCIFEFAGGIYSSTWVGFFHGVGDPSRFCDDCLSLDILMLLFFLLALSAFLAAKPVDINVDPCVGSNAFKGL